ncbi:MAG: hypothetical protein ACTS73_08720 [Arsenophonus sp. NEOnobi-MAG3]
MISIHTFKQLIPVLSYPYYRSKYVICCGHSLYLQQNYSKISPITGKI